MKTKSKQTWTDVHDDDLMVSLSIRKPIVVPRDPSVWTKSKNQKKTLRNARNSHKEVDGHFGTVPEKHIPVRSKLIIKLFKNNKYPKTTYSMECWQNEIPFIVANYSDFISEYFWNGKTYKPNEIPFWGFAR